uniref:Uncharacterized protein n=1 Tax=Ciona savignyi TaxID=51511 RepID=H2Y6E3_CIOSA
SLRSSGGDFILQLQQDNESLRREIDIKESKLQANMNSIKTFWSPELKKERALRKEESNQIATLKEQWKHLHLTMQALQDELRAQRDLNQLLHDDFTMNPVDTENYERTVRENELLQSTLEELETRIEAQRQTLETRDESVRKLLEMVQCKGLPKPDDGGSDTDALRAQIVGYEARLASMEGLLQEKKMELQKFKVSIKSKYSGSNDGMSSNIEAYRQLLEAKESKILSLERSNHELELELESVNHNAEVGMTQHNEDMKQLEVVKSHADFMKHKVGELDSDVQKKETEIVTLQTRLDTLNNQQSDRQHIDVLKESLAAKDQRASVLQSEKQAVLDEKQDYLLRLQEDKSGDTAELSHLRDTLDVKDRKIMVLHKKIESLSEVLRDKDRVLDENKRAMAELEQDSCTSDSALTTMEEALADKDKVVEALQKEHASSCQQFRDESADLRQCLKNAEQQLDSLRREMSEKESSISELQERASSLASSMVKKDSHIKQLEINVQKSFDDVTRLQTQHLKAQQLAMSETTKEEFNSKIQTLENEVKLKAEEATRCQGDLDRLLGILKETENEKHLKDKKIATFEKRCKEQATKIKSMQNEMIQDAQRKGAAQDRDIKSKDERVEELEEALRESVSITAEREMLLAKMDEKAKASQQQLSETTEELSKTKSKLDEVGKKLTSVESSLTSKDRILVKMKMERRKQLEERLEMKQEALLAAISEKDSNIALLELSQSRKKTNAEEVCLLRREKDSLVQQLKQQTQNRLKLMQQNFD